MLCQCSRHPQGVPRAAPLSTTRRACRQPQIPSEQQTCSSVNALFETTLTPAELRRCYSLYPHSAEGARSARNNALISDCDTVLGTCRAAVGRESAAFRPTPANSGVDVGQNSGEHASEEAIGRGSK